MKKIKRFQMPIALVAVFLGTHFLYTNMQTRSSVIKEVKDEKGNVVSTEYYVKGRVLSVARSLDKTPENLVRNLEERLNVDEDEAPLEEPSDNVVRIMEVELLGGQHKGKRSLFRIDLQPLSFPMLNTNVEPGDIILCRVGGSGEILNARGNVQGYSRDQFIIGLLGILFAVVVIVGRSAGIRAALTMVVNGFILYYIMLPMIHKGYDPIWSIVLTCALISFQSRLIVAGFGRKTYAAILGTMGGVVIAGFLVIYAQEHLHFTGLEKANATDLVASQSVNHLDFAGLLMAGMLIGLLGVANDAAIEVASAIEEVNEANPNLSIPRLVASGMNVGTDILGTMTNTVVFVYFGMRLLIVLAVTGTDVFPYSAMQLFSLSVIAAEIVRIISGTLGLVITIPLTAAIAGLFHARARQLRKESA